MKGMNLEKVIAAVEGTLINNVKTEAFITGVSTDSRNTKNGEIFIALNGVNMDGHNYITKAIENGGVAVIVERAVDTVVPQILVKDTFVALKRLAQEYRATFNIPVIGVTGSTGKTSTKEIIGSVLKEHFKVHKTKMNYNNEIGLPLTIFELNEEDEISILEMGMNNLGEIQRLSEIAKPSIGVITNVGTAHIENLGSRENILKAKMEITTYFKAENVLIINNDDEYLGKLENNNYSIIRLSLKNNGDYNGFDVKNLGEFGVSFKCIYRNNTYEFKLNTPGLHNVYNALSAIAIADLFGMDIQDIKAGIENYRPVGQRMQIINTGVDIKIINDCYNANPDSMKSSLDVLLSYGDRRKIAILGDMFELGAYSEEAHRFVGNYLRDKCDIFIAVGNEAFHMFNESKGYVESYYFSTKDEAKVFINSILKEGDILLIKASNGMKMGEITDYLIQDRKKEI